MSDTEKILFVDDEENVLQSIRRQLRKRFAVVTAGSGDEALRVLKEQGPFAVIVSDMRMPGMDGVQLLARVKDLYPDTVRIMLTGNADQETAIEAVNSGQIFRFLTKPCSTAVLAPALALAQRQYRLVTAEKELLEKTLRGAVTVLSELLSQAKPTVFSAGLRIKQYALDTARRLNLPNLWQVEVAALLAQIGCIALPTDILNKRYAGLALDEEEETMWEGYPEVGARLLENIPRLDGVIWMIRHQLRDFADFDEQTESEVFEEVLIGAQLLRTVIDLDILLHQGLSPSQAVEEMQGRSRAYNPRILEELRHISFPDQARTLSLNVDDLSVGMIAEEDIAAKNGALILPRGQEITWPILQALYNFNRQVGVIEPIMVRLGREDDIPGGTE